MKARRLWMYVAVLTAGVMTLCASQAAAVGGANISSVSPKSGPLTGGTTVTVTGGSMTGLSFAVAGARILENTATRIVFVTPPCSTAGAKTITATGSVGDDTDSFTYVALSLAGITPASGPLTGGTEVTITGNGFGYGPTVTIGGVAATDVVYSSMTELRAVVPQGGAAGAKDVVVTNTNDKSATLAGGYSYYAVNSTTGTVDANSGGTATINPGSGNITVSIPGGTFGANVTLAVSSVTVPASGQSTVKITDIGIDITNSAGLQPGKEITITVYYRDADIAGLEESKLSLARYDSGMWVPIPTVVYAGQNKLVGTIKHLSTFAVVQLAPAADLAGVKVYPNPFDPKNGALTLANLTGEAGIKIYNVAGELVRTINYTSATGQATWDGRNDGGNMVASGVYLAFINSPQGKKTIKIAVER